MTIKEAINKLLPMDKEKEISLDGPFTFCATTDITVGYFLDIIINDVRYKHTSSEDPLIMEYGSMKLEVWDFHEDEDEVQIRLRRME